MSDYIPQVGDTITKLGWEPFLSLTVVATHGRLLLADYAATGEPSSVSWDLDAGDWVKVIPVADLPGVWINVYPFGFATGSSHGRRESADMTAKHDRIAVVHIWTDADGDHAEIERAS